MSTAEDVNARFGIRPQYRLPSIMAMSSIVGVFWGFYRGFSETSLVYLAENSHRLPKTVGGWYFYHKRKNYVCIKNGLVNSLKTSLKLGSAVTGYFALEAYLDQFRGTVDFANTTVATGLGSLVYAKIKHFSKYQTKHIFVRALGLGLVSGLAQDFFIWGHGGELWYLK